MSSRASSMRSSISGGPPAFLVVALHRPHSTAPQEHEVLLPRTTGLRTTFGEVVRQALARAAAAGRAVSDDARLVVEVDGIECSLKSTPQQYGMDSGERVEVRVGHAYVNTY